LTEYHHSAHAVWDIKYHLGWITKYRYKMLRGDVAERARELIRQICEAREVQIIRGAVSPDHIHILVVAPPQLAPAKLVQFIKGRSPRTDGQFLLMVVNDDVWVPIAYPLFYVHAYFHGSEGAER
jgi:REP-associated tyrosine transposase